MEILKNKFFIPGLVYFLCCIVCLLLYFQNLVFLSIYSIFFLQGCALIYFSEKIYTKNKVTYQIYGGIFIKDVKFSMRKYLRFPGICIFILCLGLIIEYLMFHVFGFIDKFILISFIYILTAIVLSYLLVWVVELNIRVVDFQFIAGICIITLFIHLGLIYLFADVPIVFFRAFGFVLDVYLLLQFIGLINYQISCNNSFIQYRGNVPYE